AMCGCPDLRRRAQRTLLAARLTYEHNDTQRGVIVPAAPASSLTVSVVIPVKDDADLLRRCLHALSRQSVPADEILIVDNASTDASAQVAIDAGATVVRCETPGIPAASAYGYDRATGQIILRLDADCVP